MGRVPTAIRAQLRLQAARDAANRQIVYPAASQAAKDTKAELDSIRDPASKQALQLTADVEAVSLRTTLESRPAGVERFFLDTWPKLVYANPSVRFGVHLHYTRGSLLRLNRTLEQQARELESRMGQIKESIRLLEVMRVERKKQRAQDMGVTALELDSIDDAEDQVAQATIEARTKEMEELQNEAERTRSRAVPVEELAGTKVITDRDAARTAAIRQAAQELDGLFDADGGSEDQVLGPLTPKAILDARRAGGTVIFPIRHCLEVYRNASSGIQTFDLPVELDCEPMDTLRSVGLRDAVPSSKAAAGDDLGMLISQRAHGSQTANLTL